MQLNTYLFKNFSFDSAFFVVCWSMFEFRSFFVTGYSSLKELWLKQPGSRQASQPAFSSKHHVNFNPFTARVFDGIYKVALTFESLDEILWCEHSNESSLPVLTRGTICFSKFYKMKFGNLVEICLWIYIWQWKGLREETRYEPS